MESRGPRGSQSADSWRTFIKRYRYRRREGCSTGRGSGGWGQSRGSNRYWELPPAGYDAWERSWLLTVCSCQSSLYLHFILRNLLTFNSALRTVLLHQGTKALILTFFVWYSACSMYLVQWILDVFSSAVSSWCLQIMLQKLQSYSSNLWLIMLKELKLSEINHF